MFYILNKVVIIYLVIINFDFIIVCEFFKVSLNYICILKILMGKEVMFRIVLF